MSERRKVIATSCCKAREKFGYIGETLVHLTEHEQGNTEGRFVVKLEWYAPRT